MFWSDITSRTGASLTGVAVTVIIWESVYSASVTDTVKDSLPLKSREDVKLTCESVRLAKIFVPSDIPKVNTSSSTSLADKSRRIDSSSLKVTGDISERTGGSLIPFTVTVKVWSEEYSPSVTLAVNDSDPFQSSSITLKVMVDPSIEGKMFVPSVIV